MRDAWFAGFTPDLLCVVWVGFDDNTPLNLSGARAALPIWVDFMKGALAGASPGRSRCPPRTSSSWRSTRRPACSPAPSCPKVMSEAFIAGTEPHGALLGALSADAEPAAPRTPRVFPDGDRVPRRVRNKD